MKKNKKILRYPETEEEIQELREALLKEAKMWEWVFVAIMMVVYPTVILVLARVLLHFWFNVPLTFLVVDILYFIMYWLDRACERRQEEKDRRYAEENREKIMQLLEEIGEADAAERRASQHKKKISED